MLKSRRLSVAMGVFGLAFFVFLMTGTTAEAGSTKSYLDTWNAGVASIIDPSVYNTTDIINATLQAGQREVEKESTLVMANVKNALNVRTEPNEDAEKIGKKHISRFSCVWNGLGIALKVE